MPGPGKKPVGLKVIAGTGRKDRGGPPSVELPIVAAVPPAPDWLPNAHAVKEWKRLAPILVANKLLTEAGTSALGMLCALHGKLVQLWAAGEAPGASMVSQYRNLSNDFGLTPVALGKVQPVGQEPPKNAFAQNGKRAGLASQRGRVKRPSVTRPDPAPSPDSTLTHNSSCARTREGD